MKNIFIFFALSFLFFSFSSYAAESGLQGFAQSILDFFSDFWEAITEGIPNLLQRLAAWAFEAAVFLKFLLYLESIKFAWGVAKLVL
jgi:hypothetical protein